MSEFGQVYPCPVFLKSAAESRWVTPSADIILLVECSLEEEWEGQVRYLPLR